LNLRPPGPQITAAGPGRRIWWRRSAAIVTLDGYGPRPHRWADTTQSPSPVPRRPALTGAPDPAHGPLAARLPPPSGRHRGRL